jgi:MoaA/NifB/PqqE/SkfB family radical SAM enzyme
MSPSSHTAPAYSYAFDNQVNTRNHVLDCGQASRRETGMNKAEGDGGRLDLDLKLRQASLVDPIDELRTHGRTRVPMVVELDPTSRCDLACPECISTDLLNHERFTTEQLLGLAREFVRIGVPAVILIGGGEPLLHPAIDKVITILGTAGIKIGITTNGTQLKRHIDTAARYASWVRVSVDAATADVYAKFRPSRSGKNAFAQVIDGMRQFARCKTGTLGYSFLLLSRTDGDGRILDTNFFEILQAARLARDIGCDYFEVKPEYDMRHYLIRQDPTLTRTLESQLSAAGELAGDGFSVIFPSHLPEILSGSQLNQVKTYDKCPIAELRTLVTPSGAFICPYHRGNNDAKYGDITSASFADIWASDLRREVTQEINPRTHCGFHCIRHRSNLSLIDVIGGNNMGDPIPDYDPFI